MRRSTTSLLALLLAAGCATTQPAPKAPEAPQPPPAPAAPQDPEAWRAQPPTPGQPPELVLPRFQSAQLSNGLTVLVSERHELPLVALGVAFAHGSAQEPRAQRGVADLAYKMLLEGAAGRDAVALDNAFADLGASPNLGVGSDGVYLSTRVLARHADSALGLLSDVVLRPNWRQADWERRKKQQLAELVARYGNPNFLAQQAYLATVYGEDHPYGMPGGGTPQTVQALQLEQVKRWYQQHTGPRAAAVVFAGDITLEQARGLAQKYFGGWKGGATLPPAPPAPPVPPRQKVVFVPKPGLDQTVVFVGRPGVALGHSDEYSLELASTVFGSFFGSRLNMKLREEKGYTYGANASSSARLGVGTLTASSRVKKGVTGPALSDLMGEVAGLKARPITSTELEAAREGLIRALPGAFETVEGLAGSAAGLFYTRRPLDEFQKAAEALEGTSAAEVQRVAEAYFNPEVMQVVLVGDPDVIREQVGPLNLGELEARVPPTAGAAPATAGAKAK